MSQFRLKVQPTRNYYEDENTDPNPEPQVPKSQGKSIKSFFSQFTSPSVDYKHQSKLQGMNSNQKSDVELSNRKFTDGQNSFYNTLSEDFLCTLSRVGSHIITSDTKMNQGSLEQLSFENILSPVGNFTLSKMSDSKALFHQEMKAVKFSRHREYLKAFLGLRVWAEVGKRTRRFFRDYIEMQNKKELIDVIFDLKKLSSYRKLTMQHKPNPQKIQRVLPASLTNLSYDAYYQGYETEPDELEENAMLYYQHILAKKALDVMKKRRYYKNLNAKATKFLYYKLLLKYTYKWIDHIKQIPKTVSARNTTKIPTENTPNHRFYSVPSNNSLYKKSSYTVSSLTDIDEEEPYGQIYNDRLISKSFHSLRFYYNLQKKKKNLQETLLNCLGMRYVAKPFQVWLCLARVNQLKKKTVNQMRNILLQNILRDAFSNIKQAKRIPLVTRITTKRVPGIILRQGSVPPKERNLNNSNINIQQQFEASFKNMSLERIGNKENKENVPFFSNNQRPKTQRTFRNYLDGIFPHIKKDQQQQDSTSSRQRPQYTDNTTSSNSIFVMQNLIPQVQTEDTNTSINMVALDTSHFGMADKSNIHIEENRYLSKFFDKASPIKPNRAVLDQSFFGLNVSQIEKPDKENKVLEEAVQDPKKSESFIIQKQLQSTYYNRQNMRKGGNRAQHNRTFSSGNVLSKGTDNNNNSSFSILQEMKKDEIRSIEREQKSSKLNRSFEVRTVETEEDKRNHNVSMRVERTRDSSKEHENKKSMYKETRQKDSNKFKQMISELENHLSFLNRNLLNQKLINNKLSHIKGQLSTDKR